MVFSFFRFSKLPVNFEISSSLILILVSKILKLGEAEAMAETRPLSIEAEDVRRGVDVGNRENEELLEQSSVAFCEKSFKNCFFR